MSTFYTHISARESFDKLTFFRASLSLKVRGNSSAFAKKEKFFFKIQDKSRGFKCMTMSWNFPRLSEICRDFSRLFETFKSQKVHEFNEVLYGKDEVLWIKWVLMEKMKNKSKVLITPRRRTTIFKLVGLCDILSHGQKTGKLFHTEALFVKVDDFL